MVRNSTWVRTALEAIPLLRAGQTPRLFIGGVGKLDFLFGVFFFFFFFFF